MDKYEERTAQELAAHIFENGDPELMQYGLYMAKNNPILKDAVIDRLFDMLLRRDSKLSKWGKFLTKAWITYKYGI